MKKIFIWAFCFLTIFLFAWMWLRKSPNHYGSKKIVFIHQFTQHPALNRTVEGIVDGLKNYGYVPKKNLDLRIESAQGNPAMAAQIAAKFANQNPDVVVGVSTLSAQSLMKYAKEGKIKVIFSSVTNPIEAGFVQDLNKPGGNLSGVSNFIPLEPQISIFKKIQPSLKRLGFLYNPGEANSLTLLKALKNLCPKFHLTLVSQGANTTADVSQAAAKLAFQVDAIFVSNDNTALSALPSIIQAGIKEKIPVYVSDNDAVALGALAALGPNQYQIGLETAAMIHQVLRGAPLSRMPVRYPSSKELHINQDTAKTLGLSLSKNLKEISFSPNTKVPNVSS